MGTCREADAIEWLVHRPGWGEAIVFLQTTRNEPDSPSTGELDLLVFDAGDDLRIERLQPERDGAPTLDLIRLPFALLHDPARLAGQGLITHRLLSSRPVADGAGLGAAAQEAVRGLSWQRGPQAERLCGFPEMGRLTVREVGVTWDFPALALFWQHMAHAACFAAMLDAARRVGPNVYTRPFLHLDALEALTGQRLAEPMRATLALETDPAALEQPLRALHAHIMRHCPEPAWHDTMRSGTRSEYRSWSSPREPAFRIAAAREMADGGHRASAVFYLRYCAYSLARIAMIHQRVREGVRQPLSFIRPERAVMPDLRAHHPDMLPPLSAVLGGARAPSVSAVDAAVRRVQALRETALAFIARHGIDVGEPAAWQPHVPLPSPVPRSQTHHQESQHGRCH
ncbi:hypothetical protein [Piscinibacter sp.]|uniref:hypothetical protein n=1 Tax=Piscinibacter sp. TaxID=1903157 RepID=UPI002B5DAC5C|nr:hypothetical protein [Albitalea sp.]HUG24166.1 hypothetical protein [Albitalea sp.]